MLVTRLAIWSTAARRRLLVELAAAAAFVGQLLRIRLVAHWAHRGLHWESMLALACARALSAHFEASTWRVPTEARSSIVGVQQQQQLHCRDGAPIDAISKAARRREILEVLVLIGAWRISSSRSSRWYAERQGRLRATRQQRQQLQWLHRGLLQQTRGCTAS